MLNSITRENKNKHEKILEVIDRTGDARGAFIKNVSVNHGGFYVAVTKKFLHGPDIIPVFDQVSRKRMPEGMT